MGIGSQAGGRAVKVSVIVRTFDSERTLGRLLEALRSQKFRDYELVVVDSGSTDGTLGIAGEHPHAFVDYSNRPFGYSGSLNAGCEAAGGVYLVCLSSHCVPMSEGWLGNLVAALDEDAELAGAWGPLLFEAGDYKPDRDGVEKMDLQEFYRRPNQGLQNPNAIIRRELWEEHPFSGEVERCEDQEWAHHFLKEGYATAMVWGAQAFYDIPHDPHVYGRKIYDDLLTLNELFGYRPTLPVPVFFKRLARILGWSVMSGSLTRKTRLHLASLAARFMAHRTVQYRSLSERAERRAGLSGDAGKTSLGRAAATEVGISLRARAGVAKRELRRRVVRSRGEDSPGIRQRFFLVGEMRSGTSWLSRTLNTHPEVYCGGEGGFFGSEQEDEEIPVYTGPTPSLQNALSECEGLRTWHSLGWNGWGREGYEEDLTNLTRMSVDYFLQKGVEGTGKRIVGDKSPLHTDHVDEIHALFPEAKVIHIYRDGRDVAVSLMHHFWRLSRDKGGIFDLDPEEIEKRDAYLADPDGFLASGESIFTGERLRQMAVRWSRRVIKASHEGKTLFGAGFYQLSYEELLEEPEEHLGSMFRLLAARSDGEVVERCVEKNRFEKLAKRSSGQEDAGSFFRKGVAGDWQNVFTKRDREIYAEVAGDALRQMGYPIE